MLAAACSSTSKKADETSDADADALATADPRATGDASATPAATRSTATIGSADTPAEDVGEAPAPPVAGGGPVKMGRGVTATTIKIGVNHSAPLGPAYQAVGFGGSAEGTDERPITEALVKHLNKHGGIAGRKIIPTFFEYDAVTGGTWDSLAAAACDKFINDDKVFAVISGHVGQTDSLLDCLAKGKTPLVTQNQWPYDGKYFKDYANYLYTPGRMRPERWVPQYVKGLKANGFFTNGRVGVLRFDSPVFGRIQSILNAELKKVGVTPAHIATIAAPQSVGDFGQMGAQLQNAIIQFRSKDVTRVIFNEWASQIPFFFLTQAEEQGYRPRYGFSSVNLPGTIEQQGDINQMRNAVSVSWMPAQDVHLREQDPRAGKGDIYEKCIKWVNENGYKSASRLYVGTFCDSLLFLQAALAKTNNITPEGLWTAAGKLGTSYASPYTWKTKFAPGRTDGASHVRIAKYDGKPCEGADGCFRYTGSLINAG
jgi:ABC-type branched-subunit amino acid transport system substrate-binding protein